MAQEDGPALSPAPSPGDAAAPSDRGGGSGGENGSDGPAAAAPAGGAPQEPSPAATPTQPPPPPPPGLDKILAIQGLLDRNAVLIAQMNANHKSRTPDALAANVALVRELNAGVRAVADMYAALGDTLVGTAQETGSGGGGGAGGAADAGGE